MRDFSLIGSHLCPNTLYAITKLKDAGLAFTFVDISASLADMRTLLKLRDARPEFAKFREEGEGRMGIPCFLFDDGTLTHDLNKVLEEAK